MITSILILESSSEKIREICGSLILVLPNAGTLGEKPNTVSSSMKTEEFREIKPQMNADEHR